mmetsp:Transcript_22625/g.73557  ORF Transcript_22625/g.73557 Transcript_22625/m.73557 type:complete len:251 (-) Transcript_22625:114-866(-)
MIAAVGVGDGACSIELRSLGSRPGLVVGSVRGPRLDAGTPREVALRRLPARAGAGADAAPDGWRAPDVVERQRREALLARARAPRPRPFLVCGGRSRLAAVVPQHARLRLARLPHLFPNVRRLARREDVRLRLEQLLRELLLAGGQRELLVRGGEAEVRRPGLELRRDGCRARARQTRHRLRHHIDHHAHPLRHFLQLCTLRLQGLRLYLGVLLRYTSPPCDHAHYRRAQIVGTDELVQALANLVPLLFA